MAQCRERAGGFFTGVALQAVCRRLTLDMHGMYEVARCPVDGGESFGEVVFSVGSEDCHDSIGYS